MKIASAQVGFNFLYDSFSLIFSLIHLALVTKQDSRISQTEEISNCKSYVNQMIDHIQ